MADAIKFCRDCKHSVEHTCMRSDRRPVSLVTGREQGDARLWRYADSERQPGPISRMLKLDRCGVEAKYFVQREVPDGAPPPRRVSF